MAYRPSKCLLPQILRRKEMPPQELANRLNMTKQQISDYSNNRKTMSLGNAKSIANILGVHIDDLYERIHIPPSKRKRSRPKTE